MNFQKTQSKWIWNGEKGINQYVCFRKDFDMYEDKAQLYISCDTNYSLWINGQWVESGQYLAYPENKFYDVINISKYIVKGKNSVCILVYYQGVGSFCYSAGEPGLFYAIKTNSGFISNEDTYTKNATGFTNGNIHLITSQLGPSFSFDARNDENWTDVSYKTDASWKKAQMCAESKTLPYVMNKRPVKKLQLERIKAAVLLGGEFSYRKEDESTAQKMQNAFLRTDADFYKCENGEITVTHDNTFVILDLGEEMSGYFNLEMTSPQGVRIDVGYGEHLSDLRVRTHIGEREFTFEYTSKEGYQSFTNYFRRLGGRYLQLHFSGVTAPLTIHCAGIYYAKYPVRKAGRLSLSDSLDRKIYEVCIKTLHECMHEHYEDCPWREQGLYGFDSRNQALFGYSVFENGNYDFVKASLRLLASGLGEDGFLDICAPTDTKGFKIPSFTIHWITFVSEYVSYSGDKAFAKEILPKIKRVTDKYFENYDGSPIKRIKGEDYWNFYDWQGILSGENFDAETDVLCTLIPALAVQKAALLARSAGDKKYEKELKTLSKRLKETANTYFYDKETGLYNTFPEGGHTCQHAQAFALLTGIALNRTACEKALINPPEDMEVVSLSTSQFKYEALLKNNKYHTRVLEEVRYIWGNMLYNGATTFYETINGDRDFDNAASLCHGWSAVPIYVYEKIFGDFYNKEN